jgi:hypothetical protein
MVALGLLVVSSAMFFRLWLGNVSRRLGWADKEAFKLIARLQNNPALAVQYQWNGQSVRRLNLQQDWTLREVYDKLLEGLRQPCSIGFVGSMNAECVYLFGRQFQNRVVPLVDARAFDRILEPPANLDFLVAVDRFAGMSAWARTAFCSSLLKKRAPTSSKILISDEKHWLRRCAALGGPRIAVNVYDADQARATAIRLWPKGGRHILDSRRWISGKIDRSNSRTFSTSKQRFFSRQKFSHQAK